MIKNQKHTTLKEWKELAKDNWIIFQTINFEVDITLQDLQKVELRSWSFPYPKFNQFYKICEIIKIEEVEKLDRFYFCTEQENEYPLDPVFIYVIKPVITPEWNKDKNIWEKCYVFNTQNGEKEYLPIK